MNAVILSFENSDPIRVIDDIMQYTKDMDISSLQLTLKTFDSWQSLRKAPSEAFNFGPSLIRWIETFYNVYH